MVETSDSVNEEWFPKKHKSLKRTVPLLLIGLTIFAAYLFFFVDIEELLITLQEIDIFYYLLALAGVLLNILTYSMTWQRLLQPLSIKVPFKTTLLTTCVGYLVEFFVPSESIGEDVSKSYLMAKESGENTGKVIASVLGQRIISMVYPFMQFPLRYDVTMNYRLVLSLIRPRMIYSMHKRVKEHI